MVFTSEYFSLSLFPCVYLPKSSFEMFHFSLTNYSPKQCVRSRNFTFKITKFDWPTFSSRSSTYCKTSIVFTSEYFSFLAQICQNRPFQLKETHPYFPYKSKRNVENSSSLWRHKQLNRWVLHVWSKELEGTNICNGGCFKSWFQSVKFLR